MCKYLIALAKELDPVIAVVTATVLDVRKQQMCFIAGQRASVANVTETVLYSQENLSKGQIQ